VGGAGVGAERQGLHAGEENRIFGTGSGSWEGGKKEQGQGEEGKREGGESVHCDDDLVSRGFRGLVVCCVNSLAAEEMM